jgi:acetate kinase
MIPTVYVKKKKYETEGEARAQQRVVEPLINEWKLNEINYYGLRVADNVILFLTNTVTNNQVVEKLEASHRNIDSMTM